MSVAESPRSALFAPSAPTTSRPPTQALGGCCGSGRDRRFRRAHIDDLGLFAQQDFDEPRLAFGQRHDVGATLSITQVINKNSLIEAGMGYTRSSGYLENPYKATILAFDDPAQFVDSSTRESMA